MRVACMTVLCILSNDKYQRAMNSIKYYIEIISNPLGKIQLYRRVFYEWCIVSNSSSIDYSMFHVRSCNNCVNMHVYKTLNRANGTNLPEGWLEQRRSMSHVQIPPLAWVDEYFGRHWHQLHGHCKEMISNNEKSKDEYICYLMNIDVLH